MFFRKNKYLQKIFKVYTCILVFFLFFIRLVELTKVCYKFDTLDLALGAKSNMLDLAKSNMLDLQVEYNCT